MELEDSTLTAPSVVLHWADDPAPILDFPVLEFNSAVYFDIQSLKVLLQHIIELKSVWHASWPSMRLQRRRLYFTDLKPRVRRDLSTTTLISRFARAEVGWVRKCGAPTPSFINKNDITIDLLDQAQNILSSLLSEICTLPEQDRAAKEILTEEILERENTPSCAPLTKLIEDNISRLGVALRLPECTAKQIILKKPSTSPCLVECAAHCEKCNSRPCRCWAKKRMARYDSMFSVASM